MRSRSDPDTPSWDCRCVGCAALAKELKNNTALLAIYRKKLLLRGWAGPVTAAERQYQKAHATWATVERSGLAAHKEPRHAPLRETHGIAAAGE